MTEYDYSPEGYTRYLETQQRISRWVDTAEAHRHQFQAPFGVRSDVGQSDQWDGVVRRGHERDSRRSESRSSSQRYHDRDYHHHSSQSPAPPPPMFPPPNHNWAAPPAPALVITSSKRKSSKSSKSHRSHKSSSSKSKPHAYIIQTAPLPAPTFSPPPPGQYGPNNSVTYVTTDQNGYPVVNKSPLHQIPGSLYSYSTPPAPMASPPPVYSSPPMISPYTTPAGSSMPPGPSFHRQGNVVIVPPNSRTVRVQY